MYYDIEDYNAADRYFASTGAQSWSEVADVLDELVPQLQASDQDGRQGMPIFDPKATNARLTESAASRGWNKVPVPRALQPFGKDWDSGAGEVLAEWQFSNYPFLWNNIMRTEAVFQQRTVLPPLTAPVAALIIVTKTGSLPASNSTLYFEQARAQIRTVTSLGVFNVPIRLVGLGLAPQAASLEAAWNDYSGRYSRAPLSSSPSVFSVRWGSRVGMHGNAPATLRFPTT